MSSLYQYAQQMFQLLTDDEIGRSVPISSIGDDSIVCSTLAFASGSSQKFAQRWAWRPLSATQPGDRVRYIESFTSSSGTLNINSAATNYVDQTATNEVVLITKYEPQFICDAIQNAIKMLRRMDRTEFPVVMNGSRVYLGDLDWVLDPDDVSMVKRNRSPVITRNRYLQKKNKVSTAGVQLPDWWTVANNNDTTPFTATTYRGQKTYYNLERSGGTNATLVQTVNALFGGVAGDPPSGETVTAVLVCTPANSSDLNIAVDDVDGAGDSTSTLATTPYQEVTTGISMASTTMALQFTVTAHLNNAAQAIYEAYALIGTLDDQVRRDDYPEYDIPRADRNGGFGWEWDDQAGTLAIKTDNWGRGQILVYSKRPYCGFDADRLAAGTADQDVSDAPLIPVATGAIWKLFESHGDPRAEEWRDRFERLAVKHLNAPKPDINDRLMQRLAPAARRFG